MTKHPRNTDLLSL